MTGFHDVACFAFTAALQDHWREIHAEFLAQEQRLVDYVERSLFDQGWQVLGLWNLPHREALPSPLRDFPFTSTLIERMVPRHGAVAFSVLRPGTKIHPHRGYDGQVLRCHLGLEVPPGDCALSVGGEVRHWEAGRCLLFDDRLEHEAWNRTDRRRVILLVDFEP